MTNELGHMTSFLSHLANLVVTAAAPTILWILREIRADLRDIQTNHLPHIYQHLKNLDERMR